MLPKNKIVIVFYTLFLNMCTTSVAIDTEKLIGCFPRQYRFNASMNYESNGEILSCWDIVNVYSCWGRCDSFEVGHFEIPYKISYHPVCTYSGTKQRLIRLRNCHPGFPNPYYKVFDATNCRCKLCDSKGTSCENFHG